MGSTSTPTVDRIRVVTSTGLNFRINPNAGAGVDGDNNAANGTQPDGNINGTSSGVSGAGYTNSFGQTLGVSGPTTLYVLDEIGDSLFIQNPPNNGTTTNEVAIKLNGNPLDFTAVNGFDIPAGVRVATSNDPAAGFGYAVLTVGSATRLYRINLATGAATDLGNVGFGTT
jgi:hypothetical protein